MNKEQYAVYEKEPRHGKDKNGVLLAPFNTSKEAEQAKIKYGYDDDNYYVDTINHIQKLKHHYQIKKYKIMKRLHVKFIKWLSNKFGYKIVMLKASKSNGTTTIEGDKELLRYVDVTGYFFKKEPIKRTYPKFVEPEPIKPLTVQQLKELGLTINVDVTDCKNFKEASKVQEQIINGDVKINVIKNIKL